MVKQIGKLIRSINQQKPLKLGLRSLVGKQSIGYLLSGLKGNKNVLEVDVSDCNLDKEDLEKISNRLIEENGINSLKLG